MMTSIVIVSRQQFSDSNYLPLFDGDLIISIAAPGEEHPRPRVTVPRLDIQFHDVTEEVMDGEKLWRCMDQCHAEIILDFMEQYSPLSDRLIIHCAAGMSRSPGVGVGLARYFDLGETENELRDRFPHFNPVVAKTIWTECERRRYVPLFV